MNMPIDIIAIFAWLGGACFCGLLPLGFAAILFFTQRKREQVGSSVGAAKKSTAAALRAGSSLVRLQGRIAPAANALDGPAETGLVYLRLKVERYESDSDSSGWRGFTDKARSIPFQLEDASGAAWVNPEGLDKQLLGEPVIPNDDQIQTACILLGISPSMLRGQLRFFLWELRSGQTQTVVGNVSSGQNGLMLAKVQGQPFVVSPLLGQAVDARITTQSNKARIWMLVLGIPGVLFLLCGLLGALVRLVQMLVK